MFSSFLVGTSNGAVRVIPKFQDNLQRLNNWSGTSGLLGSNMVPAFADLDCDDDLGLVKNLDRETTSSIVIFNSQEEAILF
ncbi:MAG: hypothetical protein IID16_12535 [Candidatus Marinimicrobia bacterium]|nr:hypothetical protein [Candidatus Neomarinimicrobiota bacterium]